MLIEASCTVLSPLDKAPRARKLAIRFNLFVMAYTQSVDNASARGLHHRQRTKLEDG